MERAVTTAGALLVAALENDGEAIPDERLAPLTPAEWLRVPAAAAYHRVAPAVHLATRGSSLVPREVALQLRSDYDFGLVHHLTACQLLGHLRGRLAEASIPFVVIKGPVLAELVYPRPDLRSYGDLDVVVPPHRFAEALHVVESMGGMVWEANWELMRRVMRGELTLGTPFGVDVDLHWSLFVHDTWRAAFSWPDGQIVEHATQGTIGGIPVPIPAAEEHLVYLCAHACLSGFMQLSWLQDIRLAATRATIDWDRAWALAERTDLALVFRVALARVNRCFGLELPLRSGDAWDGVWSGTLGVVGRLRPPRAWKNGTLSGRTLFSSTRGDGLASLRAAATSVREETSTLLRRPDHPLRGRMARPTPAPEVPELLRSVGPIDGRRRFLDAVTSGPSAEPSS